MLVLPDSVQYVTSKVFPDPKNKRRDLNLGGILPSIQEHGILNALIGWLSAGIGVFLIAGHRRLAVAQELGLQTVPNPANSQRQAKGIAPHSFSVREQP